MSTTSPAACVIGYPAKHSRGPKVHGYWLNQYGIDGSYRIEEIPPDGFTEFVTNLASHGYVGANVTMPHKQAAFAICEPDEKSKSIGAVNTLWLDGEILRGTNTDGDGYTGSLDVTVPNWTAGVKVAVVLGAGGASRSIVYALLARGVETVHVVNRTQSKAEAMRADYGNGVQPATWNDLPTLLQSTGLLVNTASLGMEGQGDLEVDLSQLSPDAIVSDIVYIPLKTRLLVNAERRGHKTTNGLAMLLHQAVNGFELWFGVRPQVSGAQYEMVAEGIPTG